MQLYSLEKMAAFWGKIHYRYVQYTASQNQKIVTQYNEEQKRFSVVWSRKVEMHFVSAWPVKCSTDQEWIGENKLRIYRMLVENIYLSALVLLLLRFINNLNNKLMQESPHFMTNLSDTILAGSTHTKKKSLKLLFSRVSETLFTKPTLTQ